MSPLLVSRLLPTSILSGPRANRYPRPPGPSVRVDPTNARELPTAARAIGRLRRPAALSQRGGMRLLALAMVLLLAACGELARLPVEAGIGPSPELPPPNKTLIPTVNVATAIGWPDGAKPTPMAGATVTAFARDLDHPRWLYVLPNGDVLVAETNAPPKPD